jgi:hypothetical protein
VDIILVSVFDPGIKELKANCSKHYSCGLITAGVGLLTCYGESKYQIAVFAISMLISDKIVDASVSTGIYLWH